MVRVLIEELWITVLVVYGTVLEYGTGRTLQPYEPES